MKYFPLTESELKKYPAGRHLDLLVAEYFFGYQWYKWTKTTGLFPITYTWLFAPDAPIHPHAVVCGERPHDAIYPEMEMQRFSTLISASWTIVRKLREDGYLLSLCDNTHKVNKDKYDCRFYKEDDDIMGPQIRAISIAETDMLAICRAGLLIRLYEQQALQRLEALRRARSSGG